MSGLVSGLVGIQTMAAQPAVLATSANQSDVTGNGTVYTVTFTTEVFDQNSDFASSTFTAPVTGKYLLCANLSWGGLTNAASDMQIILVETDLSRTLFVGGGGEAAAVSGGCHMLIMDMDAGNTCTVTLTVSEIGSDTVDIRSDSSFTAALLA
jgi:hypothetical protein